MLNGFNLWVKLTVSIIAPIVLLAVSLTLFNLSVLEKVIELAERTKLDSYVSAVSSAIESESRLAEALSLSVASMPLAQERFAARDRAALAEQFVPVFKEIAERFGARQFQFHTPPAYSFLRLHRPEKFGDPLMAFRHTVTHTNETKEPTLGLEVGVAGLGVRGVVPMFDNGGAHTGSVEFGMNFDQTFFDEFKNYHGIDVAMHILRSGNLSQGVESAQGNQRQDKVFETFASTLGNTALVDAEILHRAIDGEAWLGRIEHNGVPTAVYITAVEDYSGAPIGVLELAMDRTHYASALEEERNMALFFGLIAVFIGLLMAIMISRHLSNRIGSVQKGVEMVATGNLSTAIEVHGKDEIASLARAAEEMRTQLSNITQDVSGHSERVDDAAREIYQSVEGQAAASSEMSASVTEITSTMEEFSASSNQIAEHSNTVVDLANHTLNNSQNGAESMAVLHNKMLAIKEGNEASLREILELGDKSREISSVMEIINTVADQTKLIAFNAALEAASAGESGKRFSVVAAEIRRLADSVTFSTSEIFSKINQIQDSINRLVITSEKGAEGFDQGMVATSEMANRLNEVVDNAEKTSIAAQQISLSTQQQKTASVQVVTALREIVSASNHTAESLARISEISSAMSGQSAELTTSIGRFKLSAAPSSAASGSLDH